MSLDGFVQLIFNVYEAYTVALFVPEDDKLRCLSSCTFASSFDKARAISFDGTLPGWVAKHKEPLVIGNFDKDEETLGYYGKKEEIKSFMAYPLETPGVIVVDSKKKWIFTDREKKVLAHFVSVLSREVERERELRAMEEEMEELLLVRRLIALMKRQAADSSVIGSVLEECLAVAGGDLAIVGLEVGGRLKVLAAAGSDSERLNGSECRRTSLASTVAKGGDEFLLPFDSGFLRERPLLFDDDGLRPRQYFGFPIFFGDESFGLVGFVSLSGRRLQESSIGVLRDIAALIGLFLARFKIRDEIEVKTDRDSVSGALRFGPFFERAAGLTAKGRSFALVSVNLYDFGRYNRTLGIEKVDAMLRRMYQGIEYCMGKNAIITRSGKGHFYIALPGGDVPEEENILNILKFSVLSQIGEDGSVASKRGIEIGVSHFPRDGQDLWTLIDRAAERGKKSVK
jgi:GGDEF domain-containing protein